MHLSARRILVAGVSGSGKTTLSGRISERLGVPCVEMDDLHWGPGWTPRETFLDDVAALAAEDEWVTEWQYRAARPVMLARAEVVVWLDLPTRVTMARVVRRTLRRRLRRETLWSAGNVEPPLRSILTERDHIVRWAWRTRHTYRAGALSLWEQPDVEVIRLRSTREVERWLASLES